MYSKSKFNFRKFFIALLSTLMVVTLAFSVACKKDDSSGNSTPNGDSNNTETTTEITDYQLIKNGDFEFGTKDSTSYPYSSSINWARTLYSNATSAPSSTGTSGIIDTKETKYNKLDSKNKPSENPKTPYAYGLVENKFDADDEDLRTNPQADGTKILMINNKKNGEGTAQYYRASSSISVPTSEYALLSFWVKTSNLKSLYETNPGAHIKLTSSTGSKSYNELLISGVNTAISGSEVGEWVKFEFYLEGSEVSTSSLNLTFGLGQGNGVDHNQFVEGFAFFDNVNVSAVEKDAYYEKLPSSFDLNVENPNDIDSSANAYSFNKTIVDNDGDETKADNFTVYKARINFNVLPGTSETAKVGNATSEKVTVNAKTDEQADDVIVGYNKLKTQLPANVSEFAGEEVVENAKYAFMNFANPGSASYNTATYSLNAGEYDLVTFYAKVKTSHPDSEKLKVEIINEDNDPIEAFVSFDTAELESARYGEWIKYSAFVNNPTDKPTNYSLKFTFGFDGEWDDAYALQKGIALISDLKFLSSSEESYNLSTASEYLVKKQIYGEYISYAESSDSTVSDAYYITIDKTQSFTIRTKPATNVSGYTFYTNSNTTNYGIINSNYYDASTNKYGDIAFASNLAPNNALGFKDLTTGSNKHAQLLVIDNQQSAKSRFVSEVKMVSANTSSKIIVKLRAFDGANATVSLVNTTIDTQTNTFSPLSFSVSDEAPDYLLKSEITSNTYTKNGWTFVYFYLTAGNEDIDFRVEIANNSKGTILTEGATVSSVDSSLVSADKNALKLDFAILGSEYEFNTTVSHTRAPSKVLSTNDDGETVEDTKYYEPTEVYLDNGYAKFVDFSTIYADDVIDNTIDNDSPENNTTEEDEGYSLNTDVALQVSSIIIAIVLVLVILVILIRNGLKKRRKRKEKTASYYEEKTGFDRTTREKTLKKIAEKKAKELEIELSDDDDEYDYTLTELMEDEPSDEIEEIIEEETVEETVEEVAEENLEE